MKKALFSSVLSLIVMALCFSLPALANAKSHAEAQLADKVKHSLESVMGPGKVKVSVEGTMSQATQTRSRTRSLPQIGHERIDTQSKQSQGVQNTQTTKQRRWVYDQQERLSSQAPQLQDPQVTVVYEQPALAEGETPLSEAEIRQWVASAAGTSADQVYVKATRFAPIKLPEIKDIQELSWLWVVLASLGGLFLGSGSMYFFFRRKRQQQQQQQSFAAEYTWQVQPAPQALQKAEPQALPAPAIPVQARESH